MRRNRKTLHLKDDLLKNLRTGLLSPGEMIPSEHALSMTYSLTRPTVRTVLAELCAMGLLEKRPGVGTFVSRPASKTQTEPRTLCIGSDIFYSVSEYFSRPISAGIAESPYAPYSNFLHISQVNSPPADLAKADAFLLGSIAPDRIRSILALKKPIIQVAHISSEPQIAYISVDNREDARRGVDFLIRYGHRKIALIGEGSNCFSEINVHRRSQGWEQALNEAGIPVPGAKSRFPISRIDHLSREDFFAWLQDADFSAVFFTNGIAFLNTCPFLMEYFGKSFYDLKLLIFDDLSKMPLFQDLSAAFIRQPLKEYGQLALEYLHKKFQDPACGVLQKILHCSMVIK